MRPYYEQDGITIYHGDCEEILLRLDIQADLLCVDPPYGIGEAAGKNKSRSKLTIAKDYGNEDWDNEPCPRRTIKLMRSMSTHQIIWGGNYFSLPPSSCWLVWNKVNGENDYADCELAWTNLKGAVRIRHWKWAGMLQQHAGSLKEKRTHPTQKPLAIMKWSILQASENCRLILDPFMGSGTTLRAAKDLGKQAIGIDINEQYCEDAIERLRKPAPPFHNTPKRKRRESKPRKARS